MNEAIALTSIIVAFLALIVAIASLCMVIGMKLSTHQIQWKEVDFEKFDEAPKEDVVDDEAVLKSALDLQRKKKKKEEDPLDSLLETSNF